MTRAEYIAFERASDVRHEFLDGLVHAMAGGTPEHAALSAALGSELRTALAGRPCRVYGSDLRVRVLATGLSTYPDATVVCGRLETDADDGDACVNPVVVVEVLSESTEASDRGAKAAHYRRMPSVREYVFVSQRERLIEVFRRNDAERFELFEFRAGQRAQFASLGVEVEVDAVYSNPLGA